MWMQGGGWEEVGGRRWVGGGERAAAVRFLGEKSRAFR